MPVPEAKDEGKPRQKVPGTPAGEADFPDLSKSVDLVLRFKGGDAGALDELFQRYWPRLRRVIRIRMGQDLRQFVDADDLVQDTLVIAMRKLGDLEVRSQASIMQWLSRIAEYQIKNKRSYLKAQRRDPRREQRLQTREASTETDVLGVVVPHEGPTPSQILSRAETEQIIDGCVEELEPDVYREVVLMRDYYGSDWETIRAELERPTVDAVREIHRRARAKLREVLRARIGCRAQHG